MTSFFLATEFLFMATILQLKVTKRRLFGKVSLECWLLDKSSYSLSASLHQWMSGKPDYSVQPAANSDE